ncbi:hypothetical protein F4820DRAFT_443063 [Hypoxylon rubiginosum]|uniref:Uncharacterized protein n=1 Tax=Hypoxylon rubiginosum TaxID=110542 RepID=A0ACB9ZGN2_9PEZI|nr:hypothetical protein F4820DRAFT_443063 [Hypoxylon rubiginosum]
MTNNGGNTGKGHDTWRAINDDHQHIWLHDWVLLLEAPTTNLRTLLYFTRINIFFLLRSCGPGWPVSSASPYPESASHLLPSSTSWEDRFESLGHQDPYEWELGTDVEAVFQFGKTGLRLECVRLPAGAVVVSSFGTTKTLLEGGLYKARYPVAGRLDPSWDLADPVRFFIRKQGTDDLNAIPPY